MSLDYRGPLPIELYESRCEHAKRSSFSDPIAYLEDCITHAVGWVGGSLTKPDLYKEQQETGKNPEFALINKFNITLLLRYLQKTTGRPEEIQLYHDFDCSNLQSQSLSVIMSYKKNQWIGI